MIIVKLDYCAIKRSMERFYTTIFDQVFIIEKGALYENI